MPSAAEVERVLHQLRYGPADVRGLAREIAGVRTAAYSTRIDELARALSVQPAQLEPALEQWLSQSSARSAVGIAATHNRDLERFLTGSDAPDLVTAAQQWEEARSVWKSDQIAVTEGMTARYKADRDFLDRNGIALAGRVIPERAVCPICQALVARGEMGPEELRTIVLPAHVNCQHAIMYSGDIGQAVDAGDLRWLGGPVAA